MPGQERFSPFGIRHPARVKPTRGAPMSASIAVYYNSGILPSMGAANSKEQTAAAWATRPRNLGTMFHEVVAHNVAGLTDSDAQRALGLYEGPDTSNISWKLFGDCFNFKKE